MHTFQVETPTNSSHGVLAGSSWWFNPYTVVDAAVAYPQIAQKLTWQGIPFAPWKNLYQTYVAPLGSPSTGWIGERMIAPSHFHDNSVWVLALLGQCWPWVVSTAHLAAKHSSLL
jgi:hypothetical protein